LRGSQTPSPQPPSRGQTTAGARTTREGLTAEPTTDSEDPETSTVAEAIMLRRRRRGLKG
jgi:hypothetical protein